MNDEEKFDRPNVQDHSQDSDHDQFFGAGPVWKKIVGCALATPIIVLLASGKGARSSRSGLISDWPTALKTFAIAAAVGALIGTALAMRDVVDNRLSNGKPVTGILRLLFGHGWPTLLVWIPIFIAGLVVILNALGL